jgi:hypothetical protein
MDVDVKALIRDMDNNFNADMKVTALMVVAVLVLTKDFRDITKGMVQETNQDLWEEEMKNLNGSDIMKEDFELHAKH